MKFITLFVWILTFNVYAAGNAKNGEQLYKKCASCHGANGQGNKSQEAPRIASQYDWYIKSSIEKMQSGERKNPKMIPFIKNLKASEIEDLAAYISSLK